MDRGDAAYGDLLNEADRAALLAAGVVRRFTTGDILIGEGEQTRNVMFIESGWVKVVSVAAEGQAAVLARRGPEDLVGEFAVLDERPRSASVFALTNVRVRVIPERPFRKYLLDRPQASSALTRMVVGKLRESDRRRLEYTAYDVPNRLAAILLEFAGLTPANTATGFGGHPQPHPIQLSQRELAEATGASREAVVKALRAMRSDGIVTTSRREITILDPSRLQMMLNSLGEGG